MSFLGKLTRVVIFIKHDLNFEVDQWKYKCNRRYVKSNAQLMSMRQSVDEVVNDTLNRTSWNKHDQYIYNVLQYDFCSTKKEETKSGISETCILYNMDRCSINKILNLLLLQTVWSVRRSYLEFCSNFISSSTWAIKLLTWFMQEGSGLQSTIHFRIPLWSLSNGAKAVLNGQDLSLPNPGLNFVLSSTSLLDYILLFEHVSVSCIFYSYGFSQVITVTYLQR